MQIVSITAITAISPITLLAINFITSQAGSDLIEEEIICTTKTICSIYARSTWRLTSNTIYTEQIVAKLALTASIIV